MLPLVAATLFTMSMSTEVGCTYDDVQGGCKQIWVPNCRGTDCFANYVNQSCAWCVYHMDSCLATYNKSECYSIAYSRFKQNARCLDVGRGTFEVLGYRCKGNETMIFYPKGDGPFPVVVYSHGDAPGGKVDNRVKAMAQVAASGLLVLAPNTGGLNSKKYCNSSYVWKDVVLAVNASRRGGAALHPALAKADWDRVGVWGYSMGGKTAPRAAVQPGLGIHAMVAEHRARRSGDVKVPSLYLTSTLDDSSSPPEAMREEFLQNQARCKIFANLNNSDHLEPVTKGSQNIWISKFFACHLASSAWDCSDVYGGHSDDLCRAGGEYVECVVVGNQSTCIGDEQAPDAIVPAVV